MRTRTTTLLSAAALAVAATLALAGCSGSASSGSSASSTQKPIRVGALTPGNTNDGAFNQALADALKKLQDEGEITYQLRDQMADPTASEPVVADFASQGFDLIIGHGLELGDSIFSVAKNYPNIAFTASGGPTSSRSTRRTSRRGRMTRPRSDTSPATSRGSPTPRRSAVSRRSSSTSSSSPTASSSRA